MYAERLKYVCTYRETARKVSLTNTIIYHFLREMEAFSLPNPWEDLIDEFVIRISGIENGAVSSTKW